MDLPLPAFTHKGGLSWGNGFEAAGISPRSTQGFSRKARRRSRRSLSTTRLYANYRKGQSMPPMYVAGFSRAEGSVRIRAPLIARMPGQRDS